MTVSHCRPSQNEPCPGKWTSARLVSAGAAALAIGLASSDVFATEAEKCGGVLDGTSAIVHFATFSPNETRGLVQGVLRTPVSEGPFPAVVILHRYFGIEPPDCFAEDQKRFAARRWVSLIVDSNSAPANLRSGSPDTWSGYSVEDQAVDALGARAYLASRTDVKVERIVVLGHAYGGAALLRAISAERMAPRLRVAPDLAGPPFAAAAAWNPGSPADLFGILAPLIILIGDKDEQTPAGRGDVPGSVEKLK